MTCFFPQVSRTVMALPFACLSALCSPSSQALLSCQLGFLPPHSCFFTSGARRESADSPTGNRPHSCVPGLLGKPCSLEVLKLGCDKTDRKGQRFGRSRGKRHFLTVLKWPGEHPPSPHGPSQGAKWPALRSLAELLASRSPHRGDGDSESK